MEKRRIPRFTKRLEVEFVARGERFVAITSNLSENGLFIRTKRGFAPGSILDIKLTLPDGEVSFLKGVVKRTVKVRVTIKNGMGIELFEQDKAYAEFLKSLTGK